MITQEELKRLFKYNKTTGHFTRLVTTSANAKKGMIAGCTNKCGYKVINIKGKLYYCHRLAFLYVERSIPIYPDNEIDHKNKKRNDNRWSNLRIVDKFSNAKNTKKKSNNTSGITGVSWYKRDGKWSASIYVNHDQKFLGRFENFDDAVKARRDAEEKYGFTSE